MLVVAIILCAAITFGLRYLPLRVAGAYQENEDLKEVSSLLPAGLMLILVAYTFVEATPGEQGFRLAIAMVASLLTELVTKNVLLAFVLGILVFSLTSLIL